VFAKAGVRILGVKRVYEQRMARLDGAGYPIVIKRRRNAHRAG
jgi:hypothetical protein